MDPADEPVVSVTQVRNYVARQASPKGKGLRRILPKRTLGNTHSFAVRRRRDARLGISRRIALKRLVLALLVSASAFGGVVQAFDVCPPRICRPPSGNGGGNSVPEPTTLALLGAGVAAVGVAALRRRKKKKDDSEK